MTDAKYANGPVEDRSCTDIICCLIFVAFIGGIIYVTSVAFSKGEPVRLLAPYASDSNFRRLIIDSQCGYDSRKGESYLFIPNLMTPAKYDDLFSDTRCVSKCPSENDSVWNGNEAYDSEPCIL